MSDRKSGLVYGIAERDITPAFSLPMAGYDGRPGHWESVHDPLLLTAQYFESGGESAWVVSADLCQFPDGALKQKGFDFLTQRLGCESSALFLNASHTHGGPVTNDHFSVPSATTRERFTPENVGLIRRYVEWLWSVVAEACEEARSTRCPARLRWAEGKTVFPRNRRPLRDGQVVNAPNPGEPFEDRLRLLSVETEAGTVALGMVLACHPTSTGSQKQITADYVGGWRRQMRQRVGEDVKLFFLQACGGDARPAFTDGGASWKQARMEELDRMGHLLAEECGAVLRGGWSELTHPIVRHARTTVLLPCAQLGRNDLETLRSSANYWERDYAVSCLAQISEKRKAGFEKGARASRPLAHDAGRMPALPSLTDPGDARRNLPSEEGGAPPREVPLDLTLLALDRDLILAGGDYEFLHGLGRKIEAAIPVRHPVALGYTNGCVGYVPDRCELARGGYETQSFLWERWSGPFLPQVEEAVLSGIRECHARLEMNTPPPPTITTSRSDGFHSLPPGTP